MLRALDFCCFATWRDVWDGAGPRRGHGGATAPVCIRVGVWSNHRMPDHTAMMFEVAGYRALRNAAWEPSRVSVIVGANGSGKSTLLSIPDFCASLLRRGATATSSRHGGAYGIRSWGQEDPAAIRLHAGDLTWSLVLHEHGAGIKVEDKVEVAGKRVEPNGRISRGGIGFAGAIDTEMGRLLADGDERLLPFHGALRALQDYRHYQNPHLWTLRTQGSQFGSDTFLHPTGQNAFTVLRNWAGARPERHRFDFVVDALRGAFPKIFEDLSFPPGGNTVAGEFFAVGSDQPMQAFLAPQGLLAALIHTTAVASAHEGGLVAIDEFENSLHPHAIHALIDALRVRAEEQRLSIVLATHSPVVLNAFRDEPEQVFVMDPTEPTLPARLTEIRNPDWLTHFSLGDLYEHLEFGAQGLGE